MAATFFLFSLKNFYCTVSFFFFFAKETGKKFSYRNNYGNCFCIEKDWWKVERGGKERGGRNLPFVLFLFAFNNDKFYLLENLTAKIQMTTSFSFDFAFEIF